MTCIAAVVEKDKMYMAADTMMSDGVSKTSLAIPKLFIIGNIMVGFAGSLRAAQVIQYTVDPPEQEEHQDDIEYLVCNVVPDIQVALAEAGAIHNDAGMLDTNTEFLLGYKNNLYILQVDFSVIQSPYQYLAIGTGAEVALGALHATNKYKIKPADRLDLAINAAAAIMQSVGKPVIHMTSDEI